MFLILLQIRFDSDKAKPKISFPFFVGSLHIPRRKPKIKEGKFLVLPARVRERGRGAQNPSVRFSFTSPRAPCV